MKQPLSARAALGQAQINELRERFGAVLRNPSTAQKARSIFSGLESILEVGCGQLMWESSLERAVGILAVLSSEDADIAPLMIAG